MNHMKNFLDGLTGVLSSFAGKFDPPEPGTSDDDAAAVCDDLNYVMFDVAQATEWVIARVENHITVNGPTREPSKQLTGG